MLNRSATLKLLRTPRWPLFRPPSSSGTLIAKAYVEELRGQNLLLGAELLPLHGTTEYFLLASTIDLGMPYNPSPATVCAECGRSSGGSPRFYRQYRKPQTLADVYFCPRAGQHVPIVSGRLAQEFSRRLGGHPTIDLWVAGWHPDHDEDVQVPPL